MTEETATSSPGFMGFPTGSDRSVQELRLDFRQDFRDLKVGLTGRISLKKDGKFIEEIVNPGAPMCVAHFQKLLSMVFISSTKSVTLSRIHESVAQKFIVDTMDGIQAWMTSQCLKCENCTVGSYPEISPHVQSIESFLFGNFHRAVGGWEAERLSTMQSVTSHETFMSQNNEPRRFRLFGGGR